MTVVARATRAGETANAGKPGSLGDASVMEAEVAAAALDVDVENGLSSQEASRRLARNGLDELCVRPSGQRPGGASWRSSRIR